MTRNGQAVVCIDGVVCTALKKLTADISWERYAAALDQRRADLDVLHLKQTHDWAEILSGRASVYSDLLSGMAEEVLRLASPKWRSIVVLSYSLGGLAALDLAKSVSQLKPELLPEELCYVTFGTPFGGTGYLGDEMLKRLRISYLGRVFDRETTRRYFRELLGFARTHRLKIMLGEITRDEMVAPHSAQLPAEWLEFVADLPGLAWTTFTITPQRILRAHDGLLHDPLALAYTDGLVDGLLPPPEAEPYTPPDALWGRTP